MFYLLQVVDMLFLKFNHLISSLLFTNVLSAYSDTCSVMESWGIFKKTIPYACLFFAGLYYYITSQLRISHGVHQCGLGIALLQIILSVSTVVYLVVGLSIFISTYFFPNPEVMNQVSPVVCHLSSSVPPSVSPVSVISPYEGCYVKFNEASLLTSSFKVKSYPYMVFGGVEPYTTSLGWKVPCFISDSKFYVLLEKIF